MKKILTLLILILTTSVMAEETVRLEGFTEPTWQDFAPPTFADVTEPRGIGKLNETATYWYKRKVDFETNIEECRNIEDYSVKLACYQKLKVRQYQLNSDYNARIEAQDQSRLGPQEMLDRTDNMLPVSGYIDAITKFQPNELRY